RALTQLCILSIDVDTVFIFFFFFFQAEDGIRDFHVTGVQTCALPICCARDAMNNNASARGVMSDAGSRRMRRISSPTAVPPGSRSEERRVGKECRSRGWAER